MSQADADFISATDEQAAAAAGAPAATRESEADPQTVVSTIPADPIGDDSGDAATPGKTSEDPDFYQFSDEELADPDAFDRETAEFLSRPADPAEEQESRPHRSSDPDEERRQESPATTPEATREGADPEKSGANNYRIDARSELDKRAFAMMKRNPDLDGEECYAKARAAMEKEGLLAPRAAAPVAQPDAAPTTPEPEAEPPEFQTVDEVEDRIRELEDEEVRAYEEDYDFEKAGAAKREQLRLRREVLPQVRDMERRRAEEYDTAISASEAAVVNLYPQAKDPDSPFAQRMGEIDRAWREAGDKRYFATDKPETIAAIVALEQGVKPMGSAAPAVPAGGSGSDTGKDGAGPRPPVPQSQHRQEHPQPQTPPGPASGSARTSPTTPEQTLERRIEAVNDPDEYDRLVSSLPS